MKNKNYRYYKQFDQISSELNGIGRIVKYSIGWNRQLKSLEVYDGEIKKGKEHGFGIRYEYQHHHGWWKNGQKFGLGLALLKKENPSQ